MKKIELDPQPYDEENINVKAGEKAIISKQRKYRGNNGEESGLKAYGVAAKAWRRKCENEKANDIQWKCEEMQKQPSWSENANKNKYR